MWLVLDTEFLLLAHVSDRDLVGVRVDLHYQARIISLAIATICFLVSLELRGRLYLLLSAFTGRWEGSWSV